MNYSPILIIAGEPNSIFIEIFIKSIKFKKFKSPLILIASKNLIELQLKHLKFKIKINKLNPNKLNLINLNNKKINLIDVDYKQRKAFENISFKSKNYIENSFNLALELVKKKVTNKIINGPVSKKYFLSKKFLGITEYLAEKTNSKNFAMLIYNKELSVCPITTHLPLKFVAKSISKKNIIKKILLIEKFYINKLKVKPKIAVVGINPHCESIDNFDEDKKILIPAIKYLYNKKINIAGPFPADTIFLKENRKKYNIIIGMYHDQILTPLKTLYEYDAINITLGLPFLRVTPDHGPNEKMLGRNISNPLSLIRAIQFLEKN